MVQENIELSTEELARVDEAMKREMQETMPPEDAKNRKFFAEIKELIVSALKERKDPFLIELNRLKNRKQESNISFEICVLERLTCRMGRIA